MKIKFNIYLKSGLGVKAIVAWEQGTVKRRNRKKQARLWIVIIEPVFYRRRFPFFQYLLLSLYALMASQMRLPISFVPIFLVPSL